jgi:hypothetical protein
MMLQVRRKMNSSSPEFIKNVLKSVLIMIVLLLISFLSVGKLTFAAGEPSSPLQLTGTIEYQPDAVSNFTLIITVESSIPLEQVSLEIRAPQEVEFNKQEWNGSIDANQSLLLSFYGSVLQEGEWSIAPYIYASTETTSFGAGETLKIIRNADGIEWQRVIGEAISQGPGLNWPKDIPFPETISPPKNLRSMDEQNTLLGDVETARFFGSINYEARDQFAVDYKERPLPNARVELWDIDEAGIRLLTPNGFYTDSQGDYSIEVPVLDTDGTGIDPILLIYSTDDTIVDVQTPSGFTWFYIGFYPDSDISSGDHRYDISISSAFDTEPFFIFDMIRRVGHKNLSQQVDWATSEQLAVKWPATCIDLEHKKSCYFNERIYLNDDDGWDPDVILHEYTHFVLARSEYYGNARAVAACLFQYPPFVHFYNQHITKSCAWNEGWADFLQAVLQDDANYVDTFEDGLGNVNVSINQDIETPGHLPEVPQDGFSNSDVEGAVTSVLWDIYDRPANGGSEDEDFDEVGLNLDGPNNNGLWTLTTSKTPNDIEEFWNDWTTSGNGQECRISTMMREYGIPLGPMAYKVETKTNAIEGAIEVSPIPDCPFDKYSQGTVLGLQAVPKPGYEFFTWQLSPSVPMPSPPVDLNSPSIQLTVDRDWMVEAWFTPISTSTPVPPSTIRVPILSGSDDAGDVPPYPEIGSCSYHTNANEVYFGECPDGADITSGFRFQNVSIPQGATIQNAYLSFTVNGHYATALTLSILGQNSGNASSFSSADRPEDRPTTSASVPWSVQAADVWELGYERNTPDISSILQEIVDRSDWAAGNSLVIIVKDQGDEGGKHRRVMGFERPTTTYNGHVAELVVTFGGSGGGPYPTPTPTPSPTPTSTPQPTPEPCGCAITCAIGFASNRDQENTLGYVGKLPGLAQLLYDSFDFIPLLQDFRDTIMLNTEEGQHYNDLYVSYSPELAAIFLQHNDLWEEGLETIGLFTDGFEAMLNGAADDVYLTRQQVDAVDSFLSALADVASPELQAILLQEREALPLSQLVGMTFAQAQGQVLNNLPPDALPGGPYILEEGGEITLMGSARDAEHDPLSFAWDTDSDGSFETDGSLALFSAQNKDGPAEFNIPFRVCDDKGACDIDVAKVEIRNAAPSANAGQDLTVNRFESFELAGSWTDPAGSLDEPYAWAWDLDGDGIMDQSGTANYGNIIVEESIFSLEGIYTLRFSVVDKDEGKGEDSLAVEVLNQSPSCTLAIPSIQTLWPPDHKFIPIEILGVTDPEGDDVKISILSIFQDEVVDDGGDGSTTPDGRGVGSDSAEVRAERDGAGNGRFYHINFLADDEHGGSCSGQIAVGVPVNMGKKGIPVDDGPLFESTLP